MNKDKCFQLGYVVKVHGLQGEVLIALDVDYPEEYEQTTHLLLERNNRLIPHFLEHLVPQNNNRFLAKFEELDHIDQVKPLVGAALYLPLNELPDLGEDQYYFHELVGCQVVDASKGELGEVSVIYDLQTQDLIGMSYKNKEVLIPIQEGIITKVDKAAKKVYCQLPEGLLDIYLEE